VDRIGNGKNFKDVEFEMKEELYFIIPPEIMAEVKYDPKQQKAFNMHKEQIMNIPEGVYSIGLGWDSRCDLDASCGVFSDNGEFAELIYYGKKTSNDNAVKHMGDNTTGEGAGDDETLHVDLKKLNKNYNKVIFTVTIYSQGYTFKDVSGAYIRLIDQSQKKEMCRYKLSGAYSESGMIMSSIFRDKNSSQWKFKAIGESASGQTIYDLRSILLQGKIKKSKPQTKPVTSSIASLEAEVKELLKNKKYIVKCRAKDCDKKDFFGLSDPYYNIILNGKKIYSSHPIDSTLNPDWQQHVLTENDLNGDWDVTVFDHNSILAHQLIGECKINPKSIIDQKKEFKFELVNPKKKYSKKLNSGEFYIRIDRYAGPVNKLKELQQIQKKYDMEMLEYQKNAMVYFFK
jgi:tellurium resistance protein TerZ